MGYICQIVIGRNIASILQMLNNSFTNFPRIACKRLPLFGFNLYMLTIDAPRAKVMCLQS